MPRTLLLTFIHGFKGSDTKTFYGFPDHLRGLLQESLKGDEVEVAIYPQYETSGDLASCTATFLVWLKERVIEIRKKKSQEPWPPRDRSVGVVLVAHSMGGLVASDALFSILDARTSEEDSDAQCMFPLIQGLLAFDTPYDGLARSMFVYGAFSQYQKVSGLWNIMTAASAGILSASSLSNASKVASRASKSASSSLLKNPGWKMWQAVAIRSGTVGVIAAGGVAAYMHRETIIKGVKGFNKESIKQSYAQGYDAIGQGLAYINRDNVGQSFAWLSSHLKFVGCLMQTKNLSRRLNRLDGLQGIGIKNIFTSLGENGYWSGGYFVPERTFCAVPGKDQKAEDIFIRNVNTLAEDEVKAHMSMFQPETNSGYDKMVMETRVLIQSWFQDDSEVIDAAPFPVEAELLGTEKYPIIIEDNDDVPKMEGLSEFEDDVSGDESPLDIVAVAASVPLPDEDVESAGEKQTYLRNLLRIANDAGTGVKGILWRKQVVTEKEEPAGSGDGSAS